MGGCDFFLPLKCVIDTVEQVTDQKVLVLCNGWLVMWIFF